MSEYFPEPKSSEGRVKVELDLSNYATKVEFKNWKDVNASKFDKNVDLASLKSHVDKLNIDELRNVPINSNNLKSKEDKLDVDKLALAPVDLSKLNDLLKIDVVKIDIYNAKIRDNEDKIPGISNLATNTTLNTKISEVKKEIPSITNLSTTTACNAVGNKIPDVSNLVNRSDHNTKISAIEKTNYYWPWSWWIYYYSRI